MKSGCDGSPQRKMCKEVNKVQELNLILPLFFTYFYHSTGLDSCMTSFLMKEHKPPFYLFRLSRMNWMVILFLGITVGLPAQDRLNGATGTATLARSGVRGSFINLTSATLDVTNVSSVLVVASFDTRYGGASNQRDAIFRLTDGTGVTPSIRRTLKKSGALDKGIGTLVYLFDASGSTGQVSYTLQHTSSTRRPVISSATIAAIGLTTSGSLVNLSHDHKSISSPVYTSPEVNSWTAVTGMSTTGIRLPFDGSIYVSASLNSEGEDESVYTALKGKLTQHTGTLPVNEFFIMIVPFKYLPDIIVRFNTFQVPGMHNRIIVITGFV